MEGNSSDYSAYCLQCEHSTAQNTVDDEYDKSNKLKIAITSILYDLGIPANFNGYFYLREAIIFKVKDSDIDISATKVLYPSVAKIFNTSAIGVERAIRHAIAVAWGRGNVDVHREIFGPATFCFKQRPTNSEFIATIVDRLKLFYD